MFWVDVDTASTAESDFIPIAKLLGHSVESVPYALQVLATTKKTWLLILDNADDPNFDYQAYFPSGPQGAVLMTSQISKCKRYSPDANEALEDLKDEDSKELLLKAAEIPKESWSFYNDQAEKVVQLLGSHTLALIQAGAFIAEGHCQLQEYPIVYQRQRERLLSYRLEQARSRYRDVYATFEASAEMLELSESEAAKDALDLLAILSMLDFAVLPLQIFQSAWDGGREALNTSPEETSEIDDMSRSHALRLHSFLVIEGGEWDDFRLIEASSKLVSLSLVIQHDLDGKMGFSMHPLAHAWSKDRQDPKKQHLSWVIAGCVLALSRPDSMMWRTQERRLLPHIQSYLNIKIKRVLLFGSEATVGPILLSCGWALEDMRQDLRLSHLLEEIFTELSKNPEEPLKESLPLYDLQARSLLNTGNNKKAVALLKQVVEIKGTILAADHPSRIASQYELARAYKANGQITEAVVLLEYVVEIQKTTLAVDHPDRLSSQHELAGEYQVNGQVIEAWGREHTSTLATVKDITSQESLEDIDSDLGSIISVDSQETIIQGSESGGPSTSLATTMLTETARDQLLLIFTEDEALQVLYAEALQKRKLPSRRFENNLQRLIQIYCIELQPGAQDLLNLKTLRLVQSQKRWIARQIREQFSPLNTTRVERMHELRKQVANKRPILENYLATTREQAATEETSRQVMDPGVISNINDKTDSSSNSSVSDGDSSQSDDAERPEFPHFEEIRTFLVNGNPFQNLRNNFRHFVYPNLSKNFATVQPTVNIIDAASSLLIVEKMQCSISIVILVLLWAVVLFNTTLIHLYYRICKGQQLFVLLYSQFFNGIFRTSPLPPDIIRLEWICVRALRFYLLRVCTDRLAMWTRSI